MNETHFRLAAVVTAHGLNVHYMPGSAKILDAVPRGTKVTVLQYEQRPKCLWALVEIPSRGERGWVWADCLAFDPPPAAVELPRPETLPECDPAFEPGKIVFWGGLAAIVTFAMLYAFGVIGVAGAGELPDLDLTPGVAAPMTMRKLCHTKWGKDARKVTAAMKREVFASYGLTGNLDRSCKSKRHFEVDHLISRELGGADDVRNLWPQCYGGEWSAVAKDRVENRLHKEVCAGRLTLAAAQKEIRADWRIPFRRYFGNPTEEKSK